MGDLPLTAATRCSSILAQTKPVCTAASDLLPKMEFARIVCCTLETGVKVGDCLQCWHGGLRTIPQLNESLDMLVKEFVTSGDRGEAERSLRELNAQPYHHEFVRRCVDAAYEHPENKDKICALLAHMSGSGATRCAALVTAAACVSGRIWCAVQRACAELLR